MRAYGRTMTLVRQPVKQATRLADYYYNQFTRFQRDYPDGPGRPEGPGRRALREVQEVQRSRGPGGPGGSRLSGLPGTPPRRATMGPCPTEWRSLVPGLAASGWRSRSNGRASTTSSCWNGPVRSAGPGATTAIRG